MRHWIAALVLLVLPSTGVGQDWDAAARPDVLFVMRHALAPGSGDPSSFDLGDCATQRNLDDRGRSQARKIGAALRDHGIEVDHVWTSQWCRCVETAELLNLEKPSEMPALNSFYADREKGPERTAALLSALADVPKGDRVMMVTHQVNITALTGVFPASGEILILERDDDGIVGVVGRIGIAP